MPINLFNEKIFIALWFWMVFVMVMNILSFFSWFIRMISPGDRLNYVKNHLWTMTNLDEDDPEGTMVEDFAKGYLQVIYC